MGGMTKAAESLLLDLDIFLGVVNKQYRLVRPRRAGAEYYFERKYRRGLVILVYPSIRREARGRSKLTARKMRVLVRPISGREELVRLKDLIYDRVAWRVDLFHLLSLLHAVVMETPHCKRCQSLTWPRENERAGQPVIYVCSRCQERSEISLPHHLAEQLRQHLPKQC